MSRVKPTRWKRSRSAYRSSSRFDFGARVLRQAQALSEPRAFRPARRLCVVADDDEFHVEAALAQDPGRLDQFVRCP